MRRLRFALPIIAVIALIAMGCGGSFIGGGTSQALDGSWTLDSITYNGSTQTCPATAVINSKTSVSCARFTDTYNNDGSMVRTTADGVTTVVGSFNYNGSLLTIAFNNIDTQVPVSLASNGVSFTTTQDIFGYNISYTYVKQ